MQEVVKIGNNDLQIKVYKGQRVVSFSDIDKVHERGTETAKYRFRDNKKHFISGIDYFEVTREDVGANFATTYGFSNKAPKGILVTESGYLMIVKSFTDDLAWKVQRQLVNGYFRAKEVLQMVQQPQNDFSTLCVQVNGIERELDNFYDRLNALEEALNHSRPQTTLAYIGMEQKPIIDPIRDNIERLAVLYNDGSKGYNCTFRKVYLAMGVDWKYRRTRYKNQKGE